MSKGNIFSGLITMVYLLLAISAVAIPVATGADDMEVRRALQDADRLKMQGESEEALSVYEGILKKYPDSERKNEILLEMATCYRQLGDDDSAIETYMRMISANPNNPEASQAVSQMINLYSRRYQFDEVITMSRRIVQQFPGTESAAMAIYRIAGYFYSEQEFQQAILEYESFMDQFPKSIMGMTAFNRLISLYMNEGMFEKAESKLTEKLAQNPEDTYVLRQLGYVHQKQGEYSKAMGIYQRIQASNPNDMDIYERLGELYAEMGDKEKAIAEWSKITSSAPGQYSRHQMLAYILKTHGFYDQAAAEYREAIRLKPEMYYLYKQLADVYVVKKRFDQALDVYLDALTVFPVNHPDRQEITTSMLQLCELEGLYDGAIAKLKTHLAQSPDSVPALISLADLYFHRGDFDNSLEQFRLIASRYKDNGAILFERGQTLEREHQLDHAIRFYQTAQEMFPESANSAKALFHISQLKYQTGDSEEAISSLQTLISGEGAEGADEFVLLASYTLMGDIYLQQLHNVEAAFSKYTEARDKLLSERVDKRLYDQLPELRMKIAECYRIMGDYDAAEKELDSIQTASGSRSTSAQIAKMRGDIYFSSGDFNAALANYEEASKWLMNAEWVNDALDRVALFKEYSSGSEDLLKVHSQTELLRKRGDYAAALAVCTSAIEKYGRGDTDRIQLEIGELLAFQKNTTEAISAYKKLIQSESPLASEAQFRIANMYSEQLGDPEKAIEEYSALIENYPDSILLADARKQIRRLALTKTHGDSLP